MFVNSQAGSSSVQDIYDARSGAAAGGDIRRGHLGRLPARGMDGFAGPTQRGKTAEVPALELAAVLTDYGHAVDSERHQIVTQHLDAQARLRAEIPALLLKLGEVCGVTVRMRTAA